ncbi:MAG: hypothetical protein NW224_04350, partial [Leptolyngbyaceae cyanobacterium bins.302]|nr:hypothetical protein [Leptolyngbyaceae cyanobacterium bins.302]
LTRCATNSPSPPQPSSPKSGRGGSSTLSGSLLPALGEGLGMRTNAEFMGFSEKSHIASLVTCPLPND